MRLPNGYGGVTKLSGRRRKPYMVRKTIGWHIDKKNRQEGSGLCSHRLRSHQIGGSANAC